MSRPIALLALLVSCLGLTACFEDDVCTEISTCGVCASEYVANSCKWCPSDSTCSAYGESSSCSYSELKDDADECGGTSGACNSPYSGPAADPQSSSFCQAAYHYGCQGQTSRRDDNCRVYAQFEADNPGMASCPYCP
ncbi:hypothetical protein SAMN05443572_112104 [Myxococcus fulvus]|uniref:Lipoprotein n=1 Tax=Myxococcus fulvus TaxID=33 RepID=A0A511T9U5_MYXFU|nr:hypothetical protein [Myxococcus fulvus]GEN10847.1 hypothetical protein MFU01_58840 [Myxococcus fulvus]SEU37448.1 hypothetical protein SAMN05443572_112104 [Myxococcus fulvus]